MRVHSLKSDFSVFGCPPPLYCHRTFSFSDSILGEAPIPNFLKSILSTAHMESINFPFCPCTYQWKRFDTEGSKTVVPEFEVLF